MTTATAAPPIDCSQAAARFRAHRQWFGALIALYFVSLLLPTLFLHRAPAWAWASYLSLSGACAAASLLLLTCPACRRRVPNFGVEQCPHCGMSLQAPAATTLRAVLRWRWVTRRLLITAAATLTATLFAGARGALPNVLFAGVLAAAGLLIAARHPPRRAELCPKCRGRLGQGLWGALRRCQSCGAPAHCLSDADGCHAAG